MKAVKHAIESCWGGNQVPLHSACETRNWDNERENKHIFTALVF